MVLVCSEKGSVGSEAGPLFTVPRAWLLPDHCMKYLFSRKEIQTRFILKLSLKVI